MSNTLEDLVRSLSQYKGISDDSRMVRDGYIFVAVKGLLNDGHNFIPQAIKNGAKAVVGEMDLNFSGAQYFKVDDSHRALGILASAWFKNPSADLKVIGVTGTDGKTTTASLIYHILKTVGKKVGLVSTVSAKIGEKEYDTGLHVTNPNSLELNKLLAEMVKSKCDYAVVEVTSHGIDQERIAGVKFDICVVTNITHEHLDYHKTYKNYRNVKLSFLQMAKEYIVLNQDDGSYDFLKRNLRDRNTVDYQRDDFVKGVLPGSYNESNAAAAIIVAGLLGIEKEQAIKAIKGFEFPKGRLEIVKNNLGIEIFIDFAHTPNALKNVLQNLKPKIRGKLFVVFGCAGERDKRKRFQMGKIATTLADFSVFTAEDPRSENLSNILRKMVEGARAAGGTEGVNFVRIFERGEAIAFALSQAKKGDMVVVAGKGHEKSMAYRGFENPWSDREVIEDWLNGSLDKSVIILAAGKGTRMNSTYPKVIHEICGRPMISYTLQNLRRAGLKNIIVVVSSKKNLVIGKIGGCVKIAFQKNPKGGTADAARVGDSQVSKETKILIVLNGDDSAFYTPKTIKEIVKIHKDRQRKLTFVSLIKEKPFGLGRVIRGRNGLITKIVEEKDATSEERRIKEVNDGLYVFDYKWFTQNIDKVKKGPQGEYYLVDLVKLAIDQGDRMATYTLPNDDEWQGINTPEELEKARVKMERKLRNFNG